MASESTYTVGHKESALTLPVAAEARHVRVRAAGVTCGHRDEKQ